VFGATDQPRRLHAAEDAVSGRTPTAEVVECAAAAARAEVDPPDDIHASADYRRALTGVLVERVLKRIGDSTAEWGR
jgi:carbon-monoxide dehydrogenase medium subunit